MPLRVSGTRIETCDLDSRSVSFLCSILAASTAKFKCMLLKLSGMLSPVPGRGLANSRPMSRSSS